MRGLTRVSAFILGLIIILLLVGIVSPLLSGQPLSTNDIPNTMMNNLQKVGDLIKANPGLVGSLLVGVFFLGYLVGRASW